MSSRDAIPKRDSLNEAPETISATNQWKDKQQKKDSRQGVSIQKHSQQSSTVRDVATESPRGTPTSNEVSEDPGGTWTHVPPGSWTHVPPWVSVVDPSNAHPRTSELERGRCNLTHGSLVLSF